MKAHTPAAGVALLFLSAYASACTHDLECGAGGRCVKAAGAIYGTCVRDVLPSSPPETPSPLEGTTTAAKQPCAFDADCGTGRACLKTSATAHGMCVKQQ